jgi:hypothetical protein
MLLAQDMAQKMMAKVHMRPAALVGQALAASRTVEGSTSAAHARRLSVASVNDMQ